MSEIYLEFKGIVLQYIKAIGFAMKNGMAEWEIEPDEPDERKLFLKFLNGILLSIRK